MGYGEANRTAAMQVKALEARLKSKDAAMIEERAALERELVRAVEAQKHRSADTADKLRCVTSPSAPHLRHSKVTPCRPISRRRTCARVCHKKYRPATAVALHGRSNVD